MGQIWNSLSDNWFMHVRTPSIIVLWKPRWDEFSVVHILSRTAVQTMIQLWKKNLVCFTISLKRRSNCFLDEQAVYPPRKNFRGNGQNHDPRRQQEKNPLDRQGKMTLCSCCGSWNHYVRDCPDRHSDSTQKLPSKRQNECSDENLFLTFASTCHQLALERKELSILDIACTRTIKEMPYKMQNCMWGYIGNSADVPRHKVKESCWTRAWPWAISREKERQ